MHRMFTAAAIAALCLAASPALAQTPRVSSQQVYRTVLMSEMTELLDTRGYASVKRADGKAFNVETPEGFNYTIELTVCDVENEPPGCLGVSVYATWTLEARDAPKLRGVVADFNDRYRIGKAMILEDSVFAERYLTTDGGVTLQHIVEELIEFEAAAIEFGALMREAVGE